MKVRSSFWQPGTDAARSWVEEFLPEDRMEFAGAVVVEHRYIGSLVEPLRGRVERTLMRKLLSSLASKMADIKVGA